MFILTIRISTSHVDWMGVGRITKNSDLTKFTCIDITMPTKIPENIHEEDITTPDLSISQGELK